MAGYFINLGKSWKKMLVSRDKLGLSLSNGSSLYGWVGRNDRKGLCWGQITRMVVTIDRITV